MAAATLPPSCCQDLCLIGESSPRAWFLSTGQGSLRTLTLAPRLLPPHQAAGSPGKLSAWCWPGTLSWHIVPQSCAFIPLSHCLLGSFSAPADPVFLSFLSHAVLSRFKPLCSHFPALGHQRQAVLLQLQPNVVNVQWVARYHRLGTFLW